MNRLALSADDRRKLELAGLIKPAEPAAPITAPKILKVAPVTSTGRMSEGQARANCICIHCRVRPARYYGPVGGYAVGCDECLDAAAEKRRARHGR